MISLLALATLAPSGASQSTPAASAARQVAPFQLEEQIPVPGVAGRLDHCSPDFKRRRLFLSALGNHTVEAIDTFARRVVQSIRSGR